MLLELAKEKVFLNDEVVSREELKNRLAVFAESVMLTNSRPSLILDCDRSTSGVELVGILSMLSVTKVDRIIVFVPEELGIKPPPPQIKPLAHPVELK